MAVPVRTLDVLVGDSWVAIGPVGRWLLRQRWHVVVCESRVCAVFPTMAEAQGYLSGCFEPENLGDVWIAAPKAGAW